MVDECQDVSVISQLSMCIRYLASKKSKNDGRTNFEPREDFVGFVAVERTDSQTIADAIINNFTEWGFPMDKLRGQGYDGAAL